MMNNESNQQVQSSRSEPNPLHVLSWVLGTVIGKLCYCFWWPFAALADVVRKVTSYSKDVIVTPTTERGAPVAVVVKDAGIEFEPPVSSTADVVPSDIMHLPFEGDFGRLVLWLDRSKRSVRRRIEINDKALIKKMGWVRQELPNLDIPSTVKTTELTRFAIDRSYIDAERIFNGQTLVQDTVEEEPMRPASVETPKSVVVEEPPTNLGEEDSAAPFVQVVPKKPRIALVSNNVQAPEATFQGMVLGIGEMERVVPGQPPFMQFGVKLQDSNTGLPHEVWGADLKRALKVPNVQIGDTVLIKKMGSVRIKEGTDRSCFKGRFEVIKTS